MKDNDNVAGEIIGAIILFAIIVELVKLLIAIVLAIVIVVAVIAAALGILYLAYRAIQIIMEKKLQNYIAKKEEMLRIHSAGKETLDLGSYHNVRITQQRLLNKQ